MKKNFIAAFADKKTKLDSVTGGYYYQQTEDRGRSDQHLVTERGEAQPGGDVSWRSEYYDAEMEYTDLAIALPKP